MLPPNVTITVELDFKLVASTDLTSAYFRYDAVNSIFALLYWYPQVAVFDKKLFGGWDTHPYNPIGDIPNSPISLYKVWLTAPEDEVIATNAHKVFSQDNRDGTRTTQLITGPVRDFVAALSPNYQSLSQQVGDTTIYSYFLTKDSVFGQRALNFAANAFQTYQEAFGRYPYPQFNVSEAPLEPWGGMEFPGQVYITTRYYVPNYLSSFEFAIAHETAHQWWYGLVGSDQIYHPWQDEALTQYSGVLYYERFHDETTVQKINYTYFKGAFAAAVDTKQDSIVDRPVYDFKDIGTYSTIIYNKGGLFYEAYRKQFGEAAFTKFTRYYLEQNRYKFIGSSELMEALEQGAASTKGDSSNNAVVEELYRHWVLAAEGGQDRDKLK
jgi:hypothetical protein